MIDETLTMKYYERVIYFAAGCFWGSSKLFSSLDGVVSVTAGFANGDKENPTYEKVCRGDTNFKETVRVIYDPMIIPLSLLIRAFFMVIDPTISNAQGDDIGTQYQTGIYYTNEESRITVAQCINFEKQKYLDFAVKYEPLRSFYEATEEHQNYLDKNPHGYCHLHRDLMNQVQALIKCELDLLSVDIEDNLEKISEDSLEIILHKELRSPFFNDICCYTEDGIYLDNVSRRPLFLSSDKISNNDGFPVFKRPIFCDVLYLKKGKRNDKNVFIIKSRLYNTFLGYYTKKSSYVINCEALDFIPREEMEAKGYGPYIAFLPDTKDIKNSK